MRYYLARYKNLLILPVEAVKLVVFVLVADKVLKIPVVALILETVAEVAFKFVNVPEVAEIESAVKLAREKKYNTCLT